jgi:flavorubredoxin
VENGQELSIGKRTADFSGDPHASLARQHVYLLKQDQILFSSDAFGQHYAGYDLFDDLAGDAIMPHAKKYFANILLLYSPLILKLIEQVTARWALPSR